MDSWHGLSAKGSIEIGQHLLRGDETATEIISMAYAMEEGLREFYLELTRLKEDPEIITLLTSLAEIENKHKKRLFDLYSTFDPSVTDRLAFEDDIVSEVMEGGFTTEEFLEKNQDAIKNVPDLLDIAMTLETQSLDLYMRYSENFKEEQSKDILFEIAEEEKGHLAALGKLREKEFQRV